MQSPPPERALPNSADGLAAGISIACLIHCLVLPLAFAFAPASLSAWNVPEEVHVALFLLAVPVSSVAIYAGIGRHGLWLPAVLAGIGLLLIGAGALAASDEAAEVGITVTGSVLLAYAHYRNWRGRGPGR